ncbi:uncharacterized protein PHACADRAFT_194827 [Phanerochaete carnosa HHB-10118-sp]|uniref:Uncharacterized protein n=1 Tax=Phanerochaete carnosa (strain HHB-10118-sp) TaxID=650164 RepID=K5WDZ0_PHACS|nr:uncharacterized protein PHACADRAFT_194827 [Phanerochaete carnosa HHB-10118-sp]EKM57264.1 hypothetical protein PHACADRAFT_194827 [Phanerochaete carnosa HHB-10118-sp]
MTRRKKGKKTRSTRVFGEGALMTVATMPWTVDTFREQPEKVGEALKQFHSFPDPVERYDFMAEYIDFDFAGPSEAQYDGLFSGGLPQAFLDIAMDRRLYEEYPDDPDAANYLLSMMDAHIVPINVVSIIGGRRNYLKPFLGCGRSFSNILHTFFSIPGSLMKAMKKKISISAGISSIFS